MTKKVITTAQREAVDNKLYFDLMKTERRELYADDVIDLINGFISAFNAKHNKNYDAMFEVRTHTKSGANRTQISVKIDLGLFNITEEISFDILRGWLLQNQPDGLYHWFFNATSQELNDFAYEYFDVQKS